MATIHPGGTSAALSPPTPPTSPFPIECPFCRTATSYELEPGRPLHQVSCSGCVNNLILVPAEIEQESGLARDNGTPSPLPLPSIPVRQRRIGIVVASLAGLLNYLVLAALLGSLFVQVKATHDPYDVDQVFLSPLVLRANGWTALHLAAARGDAEQVAALLDAGAPVDVLNGRGRTPLYEAAKRGRTPVVAALLQRGANANVRTPEGYTPLLTAADHGHARTIGALIVKGADVNTVCNCGDSALHRAVRQGHLAAAQVLIEHGINVNQKSHGQTALELAAENEDEEVIALLRAHGGQEFTQAKALLAQGSDLQKKGLYDQALIAYADALALDPQYPEAYFNRGMTLVQKGAHDDALIAFRTAIRLDPSFMDAYGQAAWIHANREQWDQGLALWDQFLTAQPNSGRGYFERSFFRRSKGDAKGFMDDLRKACAFGYRKAC